MKTSKPANNNYLFVMHLPLAITLSITSAYVEGWINSNHVLDEPTIYYFLTLPILIVGLLYAWRAYKSSRPRWRIFPATALVIYVLGIGYTFFAYYFLTSGSF